MTTNIKLKEAFEVESIYGAFYTGGNIEWIEENLLICQKEDTLQILDIENGQVSKPFGEENLEDADSDTIYTFTTNKSSIITAHKSGLLKLWGLDGSFVKSWKSIHKGPISRMCLTSENVLATGGSDGNVRLWDLTHQACVSNLKGSEGVISVVVLNLDETLVFASGDDTKINSWELKSGNFIKSFSGHFSKVTSITFHFDNKHMLSTSRDKVIILWDIDNGQSVKVLPVYESLETVIALPKKFKVDGMKYTDSIFVAAAGEKGVIKIWDMENSKCVYEQKNSLVSPAKQDGGLSITQLIFNPKLKQFAVITVEQNIIIHDLKTMDVLKQFVGFSDEILDITYFGKNDSYLATATNSADIKVYNCQNMSCQLLKGHNDIVLSLAKSNHDPNYLLSSGKDNSVRLWHLETEDGKISCLAVGTKHTGSVGSIALSNTSVSFAVSVSQDTCIKIWDIPSKFENPVLECTKTEIAHQKDINCVAISPNDKIIATGSQDKLAKLWSENLELIGVLRGHKRGIWCVRFSPTDQVIMTSSADCTVKLWSVTDLNCLKTLQDHDSSVLKTEFLSNGMQILTAGADGLLKIFNLKTSEVMSTLDKHEARIWAVAINSDESRIISGGSDSRLIKWKDVTVEKRLQKIEEQEVLLAQEQQLSNLIQNDDLLKALKLSLKLERPFQTLKIIRGIIKKGDTGLSETINNLTDDQKNSLMKCATSWNTNSKNCQPAQLVLNILIKDMQKGNYKPGSLSGILEESLPYTNRHFKRVTQLLQDLFIINYTVNCMQPNAKIHDS